MNSRACVRVLDSNVVRHRLALMFNLVEVPPDQQVLINDSPTRLTSIKLEPRETHDADENLHLAFIHLVQVIGEAARQVSREFTLTQPEVP